MINFEKILSTLGYDSSSHYYSLEGPPPDDETAHIFRAARDINVKGIYVFETSPGTDTENLLPPHPAVYITKADTQEQAREVHRKLWNLSHAPFIIILLPQQLRVYTGFNYAEDPSEDVGLLEEISHNKLRDLENLNYLLSNFNATAIDTGRVWAKYSKELNVHNRVDERLLENLKRLGEALQQYGLHDRVAHALIGKYIYLRYLRDRGILTNKWLAQHKIKSEEVFSLSATVNGLQRLVDALETQVNGKVFPLDFQEEKELQDNHIALVASVFLGSEIVDQDAPEIVQQLYLDFKAYAFEYIPIETLSTIYEQFIHAKAKERKKKGVIYTPEVLADYLLSEVEWAKLLERGMKIFDPACGSGVFLVLAYRRLIEKELRRRKLEKLPPEELRTILSESIYGVEREEEACYVTELSLILTLLHYAEPRYLHNLEFQFPALHNRQIFHCDFFDLDGEESDVPFWELELKFDIIVGNPPWIRPDAEEDRFVDTWIQDAKKERNHPIGGKRVAEAFSWLVVNLLKPKGVVGLVMPATSLFNISSRQYRRKFFSNHKVLRITNFANLRDVLFGKRATLPAATIIYCQKTSEHNKTPIIHYGPFYVNQLTINDRASPWSITINENEIQSISCSEAQNGKASLWKFALWGSHLDKSAFERLVNLFPSTLEEIVRSKNWLFYEGSQLRDGRGDSNEELECITNLRGKRVFQSNSMRKTMLRFSVSSNVLVIIPDHMCYIRKQGGKAGLGLTQPPHLIISPNWQQYITYSDQDFVIPPRQMGMSAPQEDSNHLKAIAVYLNSSLVAYYLFFQASEWGVFRQARRVTINKVRTIPTPKFTNGQIDTLAALWDEIVKCEKQKFTTFVQVLRRESSRKLDIDYQEVANRFSEIRNIKELTRSQKRRLRSFVAELRRVLQSQIDEKIFSVLNISDDIKLLVEDFVQMRLPLDKIPAMPKITSPPTKEDLLIYARRLQTELDDFLRGDAYHNITITKSDALIECVIEITKSANSYPITEDNIKEGNLTMSELLMDLSEKLRSRISQWVYVQRGLRLFEDSEIYIYKSPRLLDWTRTQAMLDAADIIGELISEDLNS